MTPWGARSRGSCCVLVPVDQSTEDVTAAQSGLLNWQLRGIRHPQQRAVWQAAIVAYKGTLTDVWRLR